MEIVSARFSSANQVAAWVKGVHIRDNEPVPQIAANTVLVLIQVTCSLLNKQIQAQTEAFKNEGGFTERLYKFRKHHRYSS